jgi:hypothetical protein
MVETAWEHSFLDRIEAVVRAHRRVGNGPLVLDIERSILVTFEGHEPPDPEFREIYRDICFSAGEGEKRTNLLGHLRDGLCTGLDRELDYRSSQNTR